MPTVFTADDFKNGQLLCFDKPLKWTSFQLVNKVRWLIKQRYGFKNIKVGHAGTLDPLATGVLLICTGKYTKRIGEFQGLEKEYTGTFTFGATTPSYDLETTFNQTFDYQHLTPEILHEATQSFTGEIEQVPPVFSALKKEGKRLYEYAREGQAVQLKSRKITVSQFDLTRIDLPEVDFKITCSKGTYIRSLAHDFGKAVNSGAHLSALRRTRIGSYTVDEALSPETFMTALKA